MKEAYLRQIINEEISYIINEVRELSFHKYTEHDIRKYAWLYFITFAYEGKMKEKDWRNDKRMGSDILFIDAMRELESIDNIVGYNEDTDEWLVTNKEKAIEILIDVFGNPKSLTQAERFTNPVVSKLKNKQVYPIDRIPNDIYSYLSKQRGSNKFINTSEVNYTDLYKWFKLYQRTPIKWDNKLNKYLGRVNDLIEDREYIIYRGLYINIDRYIEEYGNIPKKGDSIQLSEDDISWTSSIGNATRFAQGATNWMDDIKLGKYGNKDNIGIILKYKPKLSEMLLDVEWLEITNHELYNTIDFPSEYEVIIKPNVNSVAKVYWHSQHS